MPEVYTCTCGNQAWEIYGNQIECNKCGKKYELEIKIRQSGETFVEHASSFNERVKK